MRVITDDAMEIHLGLRLLDRAADHAYCHNISWYHPDPGTAAPAVLIRKLEQHPQRRILEADETRLCGPSLPNRPIAHPLWVGVD